MKTLVIFVTIRALNRFRLRTGAAQDGRSKTDDRAFFSKR